tara:strand:- start:1482 stop:1784 length:303 start_codon:yes stop_codon:yes gene_type:complete
MFEEVILMQRFHIGGSANGYPSNWSQGIGNQDITLNPLYIEFSVQPISQIAESIMLGSTRNLLEVIKALPYQTETAPIMNYLRSLLSTSLQYQEFVIISA